VDGGRPSEQVFADIESFLRVEEKFLLPANVIHVTPVNTLTEVDYHVIETVKFCRKLLLRIHDLLPFERTVYWVELDDLVKHTHCVLLNYRQQDFTATHAVDYLNMNRAPPSMLLRVDSPEPTELLVSLSIAPPEPPLQSASPALVLVGPSGAGKSTLIKMLTDEFPQRFGFSVSHTTRGPREGEAEGVAYHFSEREAMQAMIDNGEFLEHAEVHGHLYGTSKAAVEAVSQAGRVCILDIDVKGARQVKAAGVPARFIFISPPSLAVLERRLKERGTESAEAVATRMRNAAEEMECVRPHTCSHTHTHTHIHSLTLTDAYVAGSEHTHLCSCLMGTSQPLLLMTGPLV
jgi:guanylate kinase